MRLRRTFQPMGRRDGTDVGRCRIDRSANQSGVSFEGTVGRGAVFEKYFHEELKKTRLLSKIIIKTRSVWYNFMVDWIINCGSKY